MKHFLHKAAALLLAVLILIQAVGAAGLGTYLRQDALELSDTAVMSHSQFANSAVSGGQQTENVVEYRPEDGLKPIVAYGTTLYGRSNLDYVANYLAGTGKTVTAGINGSFFTMANGIPMGLIMTDGVIRSLGSGLAVGFRDDGSAVIGDPGASVTVGYPNGQSASVLVNKLISKSNGVILFNRDFDSRTKNTVSCYNVVLSADEADLRPGETVTAQVTAIVPDAPACDIPQGGMVLSMATETDFAYTFQNQLGTLKVGDTVTVTCSIASAWSDVTYVCGGGELLVQNGTAGTSFQLDSAARQAARSAVGIKANGAVVFYTVDGGQSGYSAGVTLKELAARMAELGCETALNLDGGGSTTFSVQYPGDSTLQTLNRPSDGKQRPCANFIFLARDAQPVGEAAHLHLYPYNAAVLTGGRLNLTCKATDRAWQATDLPGGITYSADGGTVSEDGVFTAGEAGTAVVRVQADNGALGTRSIRVVAKPTTVSVKNSAGQSITSLTVAAGKSVDLSASAAQYGYNLTAQDDCFTWTVGGGIGSIDKNGNFTAAALTSAASGTITCSVGGVSATVKVQVTPMAPEGGVLHGFEPEQTAPASGAGITVSANQNLDLVRYGKASLRVAYDLTKAPGDQGRRQAAATLSAQLPEDADTAGIWIYGDGSGNSFSLQFVSDTGAALSKWMTQLSFTGWKYVTAAIPDGAVSLSGFAVTEHEGASANAGTLYLDQLIAAHGALNDTTPPSITTTRSGDTLQITAADSGSGVASVAVSLDGQTQSAAFTDGRGQLTLPGDGQAHQVRITAADRCGNLDTKTVEIAGVLANPFSDLDDHWALSYVDYCARENILNGSAGADGVLRYRPDDPMSRQEFAAALIRFLGVDASKYSGVSLPFADQSQISGWALDAMKAAYSLGLITGSGVNGVLYGKPTATITRQEAMAILGRTQQKGYLENDLAAFSDAAATASWARGHIGAMVTRGVIAGSNGRLNPTGTVTRAQVAKMLYGLY